MDKTQNNRAWFLVLPVLVLVAFSAVIPLMTVVNYSVQDTFGNNAFFWAGLEWFEEIITSERIHAALGRQVLFTAIILAIQVPLGIFVALHMPKKGFWASLCLILMAMPLLIPFNVVGTIWQIFGRVDIGLLGRTLTALGFDYNYTSDWFDAWATVIVMASGTGPRWWRCWAMPACNPSPTPTTRPRESTRPAAGPCSATSNCRRCAASC